MSSITSHKFGRLPLMEESTEIAHEDAAAVFTKIKTLSERNFLLESKDISHIYGRLSLIGLDPVLEIKGKDNQFEINVLNKRGEKYLNVVTKRLAQTADDFRVVGKGIAGEIKCERGDDFVEDQRSKKQNVTQVIRAFLKEFKAEKRSFLGLYGAFAYDMVRLFEDLPENLAPTDIPDFSVCLYDTFVFFDHLKERAELTTFRTLEESMDNEREKLLEILKMPEDMSSEFAIKNANFDLKQEDYEKNVEIARDLAKRGELFEVVFSNELQADFEGDPFALYLKYRRVNPSPYLFYFNMGDEQLVGASPEMMVRVEHGQAHLRPISGTAPRGKDPVEDHENMLQLLNCEKERAELDMLIDLGRNDLARICEPGIEVSDYRFVEKYSRVMHTVAHLSGKLKENFLAFDALIACLNAGTLTGAPKVAAMTEIEKHEKSRRGYYGGAVGYLTFAGDMDTGIVIRTAHIKDGRLKFRVGATLLYDSVPEKEYEETLNKAAAFLQTFSSASEFRSLKKAPEATVVKS